MLPLSIEERHVGTAQTLPTRKLNKGLKQVNTITARYWDEKILPKAFAANAWAKRGYRRRSKATRERKERLGQLGKAKFGGKRDLVESGLLMESVSRARHRVTANKGQATIWVPGPSYFRDRIAHEVMHFTAEDSKETNEVANEEFGKFLANSKHKVTHKTR